MYIHKSILYRELYFIARALEASESSRTTFLRRDCPPGSTDTQPIIIPINCVATVT